jgi:protein-S-isoprenylcysteine O-methyltransferase Ste14
MPVDDALTPSMTTNPDERGPEIAGVIARPILMFPVALVLGFALEHVVRLPFPVSRMGMAHWLSAAIAASLIAVGVAVFAAGARGFSGAGTPLPTNRPARVLVTSGVYGWTRNPIYLAFFFVYGGIGIAVRGLWILILALPLAVIMRYGVIAREEAYLERRFGEGYRDYRARVRRWL